MRKWFIFLSLILFITGCSGGSYKINNGSIHASSNSITGDYEEFDGYYYKNIELSENDVITFSYKIETLKGTIEAKLYQGDKVIQSIQDNTSITITKAGKYKVQVNADHHDGEFKLNWNIN